MHLEAKKEYSEVKRLDYENGNLINGLIYT